ncbi:MAG: hypothetical protein Q9224_001418 [Gallowayella concinna]
MACDHLDTDSVEYQVWRNVTGAKVSMAKIPKQCYLWTPESVTEPVCRAAKRRRTTKLASHVDDDEQHISMVPLLPGKESPENVRMRAALFDEVWAPQEQIIQALFDNTTSDTIDQVCNFVKNSSHTDSEALIPSALIVVGPSNSTYTNIVRSIETRLQPQVDFVVVNIVPSQVVNLKSVLKLINTHATGAAAIAEEDDGSRHEQHGRLLNYDLQILYNHVQYHSTKKVILAFHDSETFDGALLNDIIEVIKIPCVFLFGIKTSIELFQEKLHRSAIQQLQGVQFEVAQIKVDSIFKAVLSSNHFETFWLGPGVSNMVLQTQRDSIQGIASFTRSLQVVGLGSTYVEELLDQQDFETVRRLLDDNSFLQEQIVDGIQRSKKALKGLMVAVELLASIQERLKLKTTESWSNLYMKAMAGELKDSAIVKDTLLAIGKSSSEVMTPLLEDIADSPLPDALTLIDDLRQLVSNTDGSNPLRSEHDTHHASLRTTVVSHKVELSKHSASLSNQDLAYSKLVHRVDTALKSYFYDAFVTPQELFLHEILVYDFKSPHREVFAPKPRFAIERALTSPRDYLGCSCCISGQHGLLSTHPATSLLYQLYLESGTIINISDLWSAFYTIIGTENMNDEIDEQEKALAVFSRALAELKYLGMIKNSRKKPDHLAKILWNGL